MSEVKLITPPDSIHDSNKSVLLINFNDELKEGFNNAMTGIDFDLNIYLYDFERMLNEQWLIFHTQFYQQELFEPPWAR